MKLAVLVDAENTPANRFDFLAAQVRELGGADIFRLFADFTNPCHAPWLEIAARHGLETVLQGFGGKGKNSTDIAMVIQAMDILHAGLFDAICLVSTDRDFVSLTRRLRAGGLRVYGIGRAGVENGFADACTRFVALPQAGPPAMAPVPVPAPVQVPPELPALLLRVAAEHGADGWVNANVAATEIRKLSPALAERHLKGKFLKTLRAAGLVTERKTPAHQIRPRFAAAEKAKGQTASR